MFLIRTIFAIYMNVDDLKTDSLKINLALGNPYSLKTLNQETRR